MLIDFGIPWAGNEKDDQIAEALYYLRPVRNAIRVIQM